MKYQRNFVEINKSVLDKDIRTIKAKKIISVIADFAKKENINLKNVTVLDIGGSAGYVAKLLSKIVKKIYVIDIDEGALIFGKKNNSAKNIIYKIGDAMKLPTQDKTVNIVICNQVYEHVPNNIILLNEIHRVLTDDGFCYFGAGNRMMLIERHYNLLLLSWLPKKIANFYLKVFRGKDVYYENLLSYFGLKKLLNDFVITDYSITIIKNPKKYYARDIFKNNNILSKFPNLLLRILLPLFPGYIFVLTKKHEFIKNS